MGAEKRSWGKVIIVVALAIWTVASLFPIYWMITTSFKSEDTVYASTPKFVPFVDFQPRLDSWKKLFGVGSTEEAATAAGQIWSITKNSLVASLGGAIGAVFLGAIAAYGLTRFRFKRWKNDDISFFLIAQRFFPPIALAVPYFVLFAKVRQTDKLSTMIVVYAAMNAPLVFWLLKDFFADLPIDIEEAALVDGCSRFRAFARIALPLAAPGIFVAFLFAFAFSWNEFLLDFTLSFSHAKTLPFQIAGLVAHTGPRYWDISAQATFVLLPPMIIAIAANKYIVRGLTLGAVK